MSDEYVSPRERYPKLFPACPGDPSFHRHQPVVRRKSTAAERAMPPLWNGTQHRLLGSIDDFEEVVPGVWVAVVWWENLRHSRVRLRDLEDSSAWMRRTGHPNRQA